MRFCMGSAFRGFEERALRFMASGFQKPEFWIKGCRVCVFGLSLRRSLQGAGRGGPARCVCMHASGCGIHICLGEYVWV